MTADTGKLISAAQALLNTGLERGFAALLVQGADDGDLTRKPPAALALSVKSAFAAFVTRKAGKPKIAIDDDPGGARLVIINDDMPFIVDSTLALLNERGLDVSFFVHPVLAVRRAADGKLEDVQPKTAEAEGLARESLIYIEAALPPGLSADRLEDDLAATMADIRNAVLDWRPMLQKARDAIKELRASPPPISADELAESLDFLQWLIDNHFTFLGVRDYVFDKKGALKADDAGLGILREAKARGGRPESMTAEVRAFMSEPSALIITKADLVSNVHRRTAMDYIGVKRFDADGKVTGELRILGLFTSSAYTQSPTDIPLIRRKLRAVVKGSGHDPASHSGKALAAVLESYPRDELFQIDTGSLARIATGILKLEERPRAKLFLRRDRFDRFVSAFVFFPRDRFNSASRAKVGELISEAYRGKVERFAPHFSDSTLVRVHFIVSRGEALAGEPDLDALEMRIVEAIRNWDDRLASAGAGDWRGVFPEAYKSLASIDIALKDIRELTNLKGDETAVEFITDGGCHLRLYHNGGAIPLSDRMPILENMGFRSISETTYKLTRPEGAAVIHDIMLEPALAGADPSRLYGELEETFMAVWRGEAENDRFNALSLGQSLDWLKIDILRAGGKYLRQAGLPYTLAYIAQTLLKHGATASSLVNFFAARLDPASADEKGAEALATAIEQSLAKVQSLDEDRIIRRYLNLFRNILRTNAWQRNADGSRRTALAFKIASRRIEGLPEPRPFAEIFVSSPRVEGIHLRGAPIARGGLRWSDRPEDFRTEVLGLQKAQTVKNAIIVPGGAKGGFVPKKLPASGSREDYMAEGIAAYKIFISSLLQLTDNITPDGVAPPPATVRHDGDDPYLVVAADKGTATFSDIANGVSAEAGFWLGDAFASGGSAGYDHKKMAITARGAWEAVKRHFRELDLNIQETPFTVIGVGDMSGDVFGNGMLLSRKIRLLAAFDHRDIFIDPDPDCEKSFLERQRLFKLPRSSWQDYDKSLISKGGGVFPRAAKAVQLSPEMKALSGLQADTATPQDLMAALLRAPCDLLWFGGIGTYVKAPLESHADAGDRANDSIRADATELRARVIGEGANLGVTQKGRVAFALAGGRIDNDAVDNSAGVNSSDIEVNLKIAFGAAEARGRITRDGRNGILAAMTDEVAALVLRNNYLQTLCLSMAEAQGPEGNADGIGLMRMLEKRGLLDRKLESLPSDEIVLERDRQGKGLTRPELSVLMAYAKLALNDDILKGDVPDDPYLARELVRYFPQAMQKDFAEEIAGHRLRREIIATMLSNSMINRGGPAFVSKLAEETGASADRAVRGFAAARDSFDFGSLFGLIDAMDARMPGLAQNQLYAGLQRQLRWASIWFLRHERLEAGLEAVVSRYRGKIAELSIALPAVLPPKGLESLKAKAAELRSSGFEEAAAARLAAQGPLSRAPDIVKIAASENVDLPAAARALYFSSEALGIDALAAATAALNAKDLIERRAINRLAGQVFETHREIVVSAVHAGGGDPWPKWAEARSDELGRTGAAITALAADREFGLSRLAVAQGLLADLAIRS